MHPHNDLTRRQFLKRGAGAFGAALALPSILPASALGRGGARAPSGRITMGFIGVGGQGSGHLLGGAWTYLTGGYTARKDVQVLAVCDVWRDRRENARQRVNQYYAETYGVGNYQSCEAYVDFRDVLDRKDIDAVLIATPAHWHAVMAIMAARAGKDIYCEKPTACTVREGQAVPALAKLLHNSDSNVAEAAATALGWIGGTTAARELQKALSASTEDGTRAAILDALLMIGDRMTSEANHEQALTLFAWLYRSQAPARFRAGAYCGMIAASVDRASPLVIAAIQGEDRASRMVALQMAGEIRDPMATQSLAELLPGLTPPLQRALIGALQRRGDPAATPELISLITGGCEPEVRLAAIRALGDLGDHTAVNCLVEAAASTDQDDMKAARQSLIDMRHGNITDALLVHLVSDEPAARRESVRALVGRTEKNAVPKLFQIAENGDALARKAALEALGQLADAPDTRAMVRFVCDAKTPSERAEAQDAFRSFCRRLQERGARFDAEPIIRGYQEEDTATRAALIPGMVMLVDDRIRPLLRNIINDPDADLHMAVMQNASDIRDPLLLPDLLNAAKEAGEPKVRVMAIRGCLNLATNKDQVQMTNAQRIKALKQLLSLAECKDERWLVLAGLADIADPQALQLAITQLEDPSAKAEAAQAAMQIAQAIKEAHPELVRTVIQEVLDQPTEPAVRESAEAILQEVAERIGFIESWRVAGPYRETGKNCSQLFDTVFPPETVGAGEVKWSELPAGAHPDRPFLMDLLQVMASEQCVAYARTGVYSEKARPARLEMGSDDGLKAWLNGTLLCANNYIGPLQVNSNKADVELQSGWNTLLLKITQNNMGWEFCARLVGPDGSLLNDVRYDATRASGQDGVLVAQRAALDPSTSVSFRRQQLDAAFRSEGVTVADFNRDRRMDVATGNLLYLGPDCKGQPMDAAPRQYDPEGYSNEFLCFAEDVDQDGWMDLIVVGFPGANTHWMRNPGDAGGAWEKHLAVEKTGNESPDWLDGDGRKELVFMSEQGLAFAQPAADPAQR